MSQHTKHFSQERYEPPLRGKKIGYSLGLAERSILVPVRLPEEVRRAGVRENLRIAIEKNVDLYQLWVENAHAEGVRGPSEVRTWTHLFPHAQDIVAHPTERQAVAQGCGGWRISP